MNEFEAIVEQGRLMVQQHAPATSAWLQALPVAIGSLIAGIGTSVLGAKFSRFGLTGLWALAGAIGGGYFAKDVAFPVIPCVAAGAAALGLIGYQMFRFWVAIGTGLVISAIAVGVFAQRSIVPHVAEFERIAATPATDGDGQFHLPTPQEQKAFAERSPQQWLTDLRAHVAQKDPSVDRNLRALGIIALVAGVCIGLLAVRTALIVSTSIVGTVLVVGGIGTLMSHFGADSAVRTLQDHPSVGLVVVGGFFITSLVLQTLLTRGGPKVKAEPAPARK